MSFVSASGLDDEKTDREGEQEKTDSDSERSDEENDTYDENLQPLETSYVVNNNEELGQVRSRSESFKNYRPLIDDSIYFVE